MITEEDGGKNEGVLEPLQRAKQIDVMHNYLVKFQPTQTTHSWKVLIISSLSDFHYCLLIVCPMGWDYMAHPMGLSVCLLLF